MIAAVDLHLLGDPLRRPPQSQFPQDNRIPLAEEILERLLRLLRHINLAVFEALKEVIERRVAQLDIIGLFEHRVRHRFTHPNTCDLRHNIIDAPLQEFH